MGSEPVDNPQLARMQSGVDYNAPREYSSRAGTPGRRQQMAADHQIDLHPRERPRRGRGFNLGVGERVHLRHDAAPLAGRASASIMERRPASSPAARPAACASAWPRVAGEQVKSALASSPKSSAAVKKREVRVAGGGVGVVSCGAEVDVALDALSRPHHQRHLAVRSCSQSAVDDVHAGLLQLARPEDVRLSPCAPSARPARHLLAVSAARLERPHDGVGRSGPVERHLDGQRSGSEAADSTNDTTGSNDCRMVQEHVVLPHRPSRSSPPLRAPPA